MALIAISWDRKFIRIAVASPPRSGQLQFDQAMSFELDSEAEELSPLKLGEKLSAILNKVGVSKGDVTVIVSRGDIEMRQFSLPPVPDAELPDMVRFQARNQFTTLTDGCLVDFVKLTEDDQQQSVLAASFSEENANKIRDTIEATGLRLKHIVVRHFAACELVRSKYASDKCRLVVEIIGREADISVVNNDYVILARTVRVPDSYSDEQFDAWLPGEIRRTMASAQGQAGVAKPEEIIVCGSASEHEQLSQDLQESFDMPSRFLQPLDAVKKSSRFEPPSQQDGFASLMGSLIQTTHADAHAIDFLNPRQKPKQEKDVRKMAIVAGVAAALVVLGAIVVWSMFQSKNNEIAQLQEDIETKRIFIESTKKNVERASKIDEWKKVQFDWLEEIHGLCMKMPGPDQLRVENFDGTLVPSGKDMGGSITLQAWKTDDYDLDLLDARFFDLGYNAKLERDSLKEKESFTRNLLYRLRMPAAEFDLRGDRLYRTPSDQEEATKQDDSPDIASAE